MHSGFVEDLRENLGSQKKKDPLDLFDNNKTDTYLWLSGVVDQSKSNDFTKDPTKCIACGMSKYHRSYAQISYSCSEGAGESASFTLTCEERGCCT